MASSMLVAAGLVHDRALADDQDPVGQTEHLLDLAGHDHDGDAAVGQRPDELVDLGSGRRRRRRGWARRGAARGSPRSSQRASTTFCWLPPDSVRTARVTPAGRTSSAGGELLGAAPLSAPRSRKPTRANRAIEETVMLR